MTPSVCLTVCLCVMSACRHVRMSVSVHVCTTAWLRWGDPGVVCIGWLVSTPTCAVSDEKLWWTHIANKHYMLSFEK